MSWYRLFVSLMLTLCLSSSGLPGQPGWLPPFQQQTPVAGAATETESAVQFETLRAAGSDSLYNLDYATAEAKFEEMIKLDPDHPAGHFYLATCKWLSVLNSMRRLQTGLYGDDSFFAGSGRKADPQLDREARDAIGNSITVAHSRVKKNRNDAESLYYLGAAYGLLACYEASVTRNFQSAMKNGNEGVKYHRDLVKLDPNYADAYLSIGLYDYVVGTLPWLIRWGLKVVKISGNRKRGLVEIRKAMDQARYTSDDARVVLIAIYQREKNYREALKLLEELTVKYPRNYLYSLERADVLVRMDRGCESYAAFDQVLNNESAQSIIDLIHYKYGEALFANGEFARAARQFIAVTETPKADSALVSLAHLGHGQSLDAMGQRTSALEHYQIVLAREDVFDSHDKAHRYEKRPYAPGENRQGKCVP
jgi:tetratricopeptide (TPR) repeat protein